MRLTIVPSDNMVIVDSVAHEVDCSAFPILAATHAVQWDGTRGHLEYKQGDPTQYRANTPLMSIDPYADVVKAWEAKRAKVEADEQLAQQKLQELRPQIK